VLIFCIMIILGVEYRNFDIKEYFVYVYILLMRAIYMEFFKDVDISDFLGYLYLFLCVCTFP
jgi:hypothetical protein